MQNIYDVNKKQLEFFNKYVNKDDRDDRDDGDDKDDRDDGNDKDNEKGKNKNLENPIYYDVNHDFRAYEKDYNKLTSEQSKKIF